MLRDGSGLDFHSRHETAWRDGQLLLALRTIGALRRGARVLVVGHPVERTIAALTHTVASVDVADCEPCSAVDIEGYAQQLLGPAELATVSWPLSRKSHGSYDIVLCPNLSRYARATDTMMMLSQLARCTRFGGVLAIAASVRIAGPQNGRWLEMSTLTNESLLKSASLKRLGGFNGEVSDELLLNAVPSDSASRTRPGLARYVEPHCVSLATLVARRT